MQHDHPNQTVGRHYPKAWIIGKTLEQIENVKPKKVRVMKRISVKDSLPTPRVRVKIWLVVNGAQGCVENGWESTGYLTNSGKWVMRMVERMRMTDSPTHWEEIETQKQ